MATALLPDNLSQTKTARQYGQAYGCAPALLLAELTQQLFKQKSNRPLLALTDTVAGAEALIRQLHYFLGNNTDAALLSDPETLPYDRFSPHQDLISRRLKVLSQLAQGQIRVLVVASPTLFYRLPPADYIRAHGISLKQSERITLEEFQTRLENSGYQRMSQVNNHGEYALRGSLIDVYPMGSEQPVRVDFFDNEIESLRLFDADTQLSLDAIDAIHSLPAREFALHEEAIKEFRSRFRERFEGNPSLCDVYRDVSEGRSPGGIENYLPLLHESTASLWDYLSTDTLIINLGQTDAVLNSNWEQINQQYEQYRHDSERPALTPEELFVSLELQHQALSARTVISLAVNELPADGLNLPAKPAPALLINSHADEPAQALADWLESQKGRCLIAAESPGRREMLADLLRHRGIRMPVLSNWQEFISSNLPLAITVAPLDNGIELPLAGLSIIAEQELFGAAPRRRRQRKVRDPEAILNDLNDLTPGSAVVHQDYGVGRFIGLSHLDAGGIPTEFLSLEYAGGDKLHVPVSSLQLISRYSGASPDTAPLHRLGTDQWAKARKKANQKIRDVAAELLGLYAERAAREGTAHPYSQLDYDNFATGFPFELTEDQATAIEATLADLSAKQPMDRLICGDVGFGKTEVALRAAFAITSAGSQVAVVAPTTLLAQQHYQTFCDRFADWPVNVEVLSRFRTGKEARAVLEELEKGTVDIVIGTHKLLQADIKFKDLGVVIIDEEHRFGVRQKEKLKALRAEVDILTLTATPIPRTLHMSIGGLRDLSLITTPPETRLAIKTYVTEWDAATLREACQRELKRGGQIYVVHNRISDIEKIARDIAEIVPDAECRVAHGQMNERELEQIMVDFYHRRFQVLVCTAIIESGLDIPNANTIIINRADRFGLAQLHQLRGRVGRSHHKAFAYLLTPPRQNLNADAAKRLDAIESMEELGAGFILATHDLEIRGAGELLGDDQTGHMQQIGFSLYSELLAKAVNSIRDGNEPDLEAGLNHGPEINSHLPALLPEDYMPDVHMRLVHYKRIASAIDEESLRQLRAELIDRFGLLPEGTQNLFRQTAIKLSAAPLGIRKIDMYGESAIIEFSPDTNVDPVLLVTLISEQPKAYSLDRDQRLRLKWNDESDEARFAAVELAIHTLSETMTPRGT
jgi:transcription-repair coupling factor (superfamily II helicase)